MDGYLHLAVGKLAKHQQCIQVFNREYDGTRVLRELVGQLGLHTLLCRFGATVYAPQVVEMPQTEPMPDPAEHNHKVAQALDQLSENQPTFIIRDKGREANEQSYIWVEKGNFYAMGCISLDRSEEHTSELQSLMRISYAVFCLKKKKET